MPSENLPKINEAEILQVDKEINRNTEKLKHEYPFVKFIVKCTQPGVQPGFFCKGEGGYGSTTLSGFISFYSWDLVSMARSALKSNYIF